MLPLFMVQLVGEALVADITGVGFTSTAIAALGPSQPNVLVDTWLT